MTRNKNTVIFDIGVLIVKLELKESIFEIYHGTKMCNLYSHLPDMMTFPSILFPSSVSFWRFAAKISAAVKRFGVIEPIRILIG